MLICQLGAGSQHVSVHWAINWTVGCSKAGGWRVREGVAGRWHVPKGTGNAAATGCDMHGTCMLKEHSRVED